MATIGLSKPYFSVYSASGTTVSYSLPTLIGKATTMGISVDASDDNVLYADNGPAESDKKFNGATLSIGTDDISPAVMKSMLGVSEETIGTTGSNKWYVNDDDQSYPYVGVGGIIKHRVNGADKYQAVIIEKVQFGDISTDITTQGETISWQTPVISGTIMRSDNAKHSWRRFSSLVDTEAAAEAFVTDFLGGASPEPDGND